MSDPSVPAEPSAGVLDTPRSKVLAGALAVTLLAAGGFLLLGGSEPAEDPVVAAAVAGAVPDPSVPAPFAPAPFDPDASGPEPSVPAPVDAEAGGVPSGRNPFRALVVAPAAGPAAGGVLAAAPASAPAPTSPTEAATTTSPAAAPAAFVPAASVGDDDGVVDEQPAAAQPYPLKLVSTTSTTATLVVDGKSATVRSGGAFGRTGELVLVSVHPDHVHVTVAGGAARSVKVGATVQVA